MDVLLTNDDGIDAEGLQTLREALLKVPGVNLAVVAPDSNRSASGRSITTRRPLWVEEIQFDDGTVGYATDGTPVDCVRLAQLGLIDDFSTELVVAGINHGANLGDDITYSGTVAAALEGIVLGLPAIAVSQQSLKGELGYRVGSDFDFNPAALFVSQLVAKIETLPLPLGTLLNVNFPAERASGVEIAKLGKRIYRDTLTLREQEDKRSLYHIYGDDPTHHHEPGTDLAAVTEGKVAITPLHFDLTHTPSIEALKSHNFGELKEIITE